jgi:hypothetical protein
MTIAGVPVYLEQDERPLSEAWVLAPAVNAPPPAEAEPASWHELRPAAPAELPGVYESWAGTWRRSRSAGCIPNHLFNEVTFTAITQLLQRGMRVDVLTAKAAPSVVLGWLAY